MMIRKATNAIVVLLLAIKFFWLLALSKFAWIAQAISLKLHAVWQPRKALNSYKHLSIFLIAVAVLAIAACNNSTPEIAAKHTNSTVRSPAETKVVSHALGEIEIPANPQRVVVLDDQVLLDPVLALGVKPVGALSCFNCEEGFRGIPNDLVTDISDVGTRSEPSLERILSLKPDLIVAREWQRSSYDLLSDIAPTVVVDYYSISDFKERLRYFGQVLGKSDRAESLLTQYQERIQELQQQLGEQLETSTISVIRLMGSTDVFSTSKPGLFTFSQIIGDVGLKLTQIQQEQEEDDLTFGIEALPQHDADFLFITTHHPLTEGEKANSDPLFFLNQPIWSQLKAVQNKQVYKVYWDVGGPIGANRVIDDLYKYLVNTP